MGDAQPSFADSAQRQAFEARARRRRWVLVVVLCGVLVLAAATPVVLRAADRVPGGPGAQIADLDGLVDVVSVAQEQVMAGAVEGSGVSIDTALQTVSGLQAVLDGARAGYVEGGADPGLARVDQVLEVSRERIEAAVELSANFGRDDRGLWAGCLGSSREASGTREHTKEALRSCAELLDMSESVRFAENLNEMEYYLTVISGSYRGIYDQVFKAASGGADVPPTPQPLWFGVVSPPVNR